MMDDMDEDKEIELTMRNMSHLSVDESMRPRAHSDPSLHIEAAQLRGFELPEIRIEDFSSKGRGSIVTHDHRLLNIASAPLRRRSYGCPQDLFIQRSERPPTPPPDFHGNGFNFSRRYSSRESISYIHHKLSKLSEDKAETDEDDIDSTSDASAVIDGDDLDIPKITTTGTATGS